MKRLSLSVPAIAVAIVAILCYSVGAQSSVRTGACCCCTKQIPEARDYRNLFHEFVESVCSVDLFTVPEGKTFVLTEVLWAGTSDQLNLRENGESGPIRTRLVPVNQQRSISPGISFGPGVVITLERVNCSGTQMPTVTLIGYLAEA